MDKNFAEVIQRMAREQGKEVLVNGKAKTYLGDYCEGRFKKEANIFRQILDAGCGEHINNADNVPERKLKLVERLEDDNSLSPKITAEYLDLLGLSLKEDTSKCGEVALPSSTSPSAQTPVPSTSPLASGLTVNMIHIPGGTFTMGSPENEPERLDWEGPQHQVTISSFYMGKFPVTQAEHQAVMGTNPSRFGGDNLPVTNMNWYEAIEYCNRLSQREGLGPAYTVNGINVTLNWNANGYRLPTEAEWEYACRAGTTTPFNTGNNVTTSQANYDGRYPYNNNAKGKNRNCTTPVGRFAPNAWGLYDMHGNVWEWCWDWYDNYSSDAQTDPRDAFSDIYCRIRRGGGWSSEAQFLRSAYRKGDPPNSREDHRGFRLVHH